MSLEEGAKLGPYEIVGPLGAGGMGVVYRARDPSQLLARISGERVPIWQGLHPVVSKDGKWLVVPLDDSAGTNLWDISTGDGKLRRITDFGARHTFIARRVSWSADGKWVYAALGEGESDIVQMDGLLR